MKDPLEEVRLAESRRGGIVVLGLMIAGLVLLTVTRPYVSAIIVGIIAMVMLHEAGHFLAARRFGMKSTEFFLGFGRPVLWSFKRGGTEFGVKPLPLGGYVRIVGMTNLDKVPPEDEAHAFRRGSHRNRLVVVLAGITVNLLLALMLFYIAIAGQGRIAEGLSTTVNSVVADSAAADAGFRGGDRIVAIDGRRITEWERLKATIERHGGDELTIVVRRDGERVQLTATPRVRDGLGFLGFRPSTRFTEVGILGAVPQSFRAMGDITVGTAEGFARLFSPAGIERYSRNFTSDAPRAGSPDDLERPRSLVGIVDLGSQLVGGNIWALLWLLGGISLFLAIFNLIPLVPFDGGHAAVVVYEWVASRIRHREVRADYRKLIPVAAVVLALLLTLGLSAMFLDIRAAFRS